MGRTRILLLVLVLGSGLASGPGSATAFATDADLHTFYANRDFTPAWDRPGRLEQLISALDDLAADGLDPDDYAVSELRGRSARADSSAPIDACTELLATQAYLRAVFDLGLGRVDPATVESTWGAAQTQGRETRRATLLVQAGGRLDAIESLWAEARPALAQYAALRAAHRRLQARAVTADWPTIADGPWLREGMFDPRVPRLRERLSGAGFGPSAPVGPPEQYDAPLVAAVTAFQRAHYLQTDGIVGPETRAALNVPLARRLEQVQMNLERMRWQGHAPAGPKVLVDIPGARILYLREGRVVWDARTQVGRPSRKTPLLHSELTHLTLNPTWTVPPTIFREDLLPRIQEDPRYLQEKNLRVLDNEGREIDAEQVDWAAPGDIWLRQQPGGDNALGEVVLRFANPFLVYLHDTPHQNLFSHSQRAVSSGCIRVENPMELVALLTEDNGRSGREALAELRASGETTIVPLYRPVPIRTVYWTAATDGQGGLVFRPDIYERDPALAAALAQTTGAHAPRLECPQHQVSALLEGTDR